MKPKDYDRSQQKKLAVFTIKYLRRIRKEQQEFLENLAKEKSQDDFLTSKEVCEELSISYSTFRRMLTKGLKYHQETSKSKMLVKRKDLSNYLKAR